jgi:hypothetical protein
MKIIIIIIIIITAIIIKSVIFTNDFKQGMQKADSTVCS